MTKLLSMMRYIYDNYSNKRELSLSRVMAMIYLADWKHAIMHHSQITNLKWKISKGEPQPENYSFNQLVTSWIRSRKYRIISLIIPKIYKTEKEVLDFVINTSKTKNNQQFEQLVHSTYPVITHPQSNYINLVELAEKYEEIKPLLTGLK